jgi:hypothetical protein
VHSFGADVSDLFTAVQQMFNMAFYPEVDEIHIAISYFPKILCNSILGLTSGHFLYCFIVSMFSLLLTTNTRFGSLPFGEPL